VRTLVRSTVRLRSQIHTLYPRFVFRVSHSTQHEARNVLVRLEDDDGFVGYGEAAPSRFFGETAKEIHERLQHAAGWLSGIAARSVEEIGQLSGDAWELVKPFRSAQCALDIALWDIVGKRQGRSVTELALGRKPGRVTSFATLGLSEEHEFDAKVDELLSHPLIKVKMDHSADLDVVRFIRQRTGAAIAVDANRAWRDVDVGELSATLADLGVIFIEQPFAPQDDDRMKAVLPSSRLPILADESCATLDDLERMAGRFAGFNIKLSKCGGLTPALEMLKRGRELGLEVMVGCRLETSASIAAGAVVAQQADYVDLDGAWLVSNDPFTGAELRDGVLDLRDAPGLGVEPQAGLFTA
jgi:L-Ala-D/L-Glu epimerase / N-acetyl-D-glutamate racemase